MTPATTSSAVESSQVMQRINTMFDSVDSAVEDIRQGKFVIVLDDEDRENEGDLIIAADAITTEQMAWFIRHTRWVDAHLLECAYMQATDAVRILSRFFYINPG